MASFFKIYLLFFCPKFCYWFQAAMFCMYLYVPILLSRRFLRSKSVRKCSTSQSFILMKVSSYRIGTLNGDPLYFWYKKVSLNLDCNIQLWLGVIHRLRWQVFGLFNHQSNLWLTLVKEFIYCYEGHFKYHLPTYFVLSTQFVNDFRLMQHCNTT